MYPKVLEIFDFADKMRIGVESDGGYVICKLDGEYDAYINCGVSCEASFDKLFLEMHPYIGKENSFAFDGTIEDYPWEFTRDITFINKNISFENNDKNTNLDDLIKKYDNIFLSMDIEGGEFPWLLSTSYDNLKKFKQICIEVHGLHNDSFGGVHPRYKAACLDKLNQTHYAVHAHSNNYAPIHNGIPHVIELTYINKKYLKSKPELNKTPLPIDGLDYPNLGTVPDHALNHYPFTSPETSQTDI